MTARDRDGSPPSAPEAAAAVAGEAMAIVGIGSFDELRLSDAKGSVSDPEEDCDVPWGGPLVSPGLSQTGPSPRVHPDETLSGGCGLLAVCLGRGAGGWEAVVRAPVTTATIEIISASSSCRASVVASLGSLSESESDNVPSSVPPALD